MKIQGGKAVTIQGKAVNRQWKRHRPVAALEHALHVPERQVPPAGAVLCGGIRHEVIRAVMLEDSLYLLHT